MRRPPKHAYDWGVAISLLICGIYLTGVYESAVSLPDPPLAPPSTHGQNLNLAKSSYGERSLSSHSGSRLFPKATWPVSVRNEEFETMIHTGDGTTQLQVPKFWSPPQPRETLLTREEAMQVGSCIDVQLEGDACPLAQRTIYVGIASYRDFECRTTVESIFNRAEHPERIRVGVVDQIVNGQDPICNAPIEPCQDKPDQALCRFADQIDVYEMDAQLSVGPVFARHIGYRLYRGEYYATQSDAHVTYVKHWDSDIIGQMEATKNDMAVLTTYLTDVQGSIDEQGHSLRKTRPIMCNTFYEGGAQGMHLRHGSQPERLPSIHGVPQLQPWWAAGYSFSRGHFVVQVPYDPYQPMIFQGEEMSIGIRGFTYGYDYYAPERSACFHHYAVGNNTKLRNKVPHFWENDRKYAGTGKKAMQRLLGIVHMNPEIDPSNWDHAEENEYGLGGVRTPEDFYETFGIDVVKKTTEGHLCKFVDGTDWGRDKAGQMHKTFTPFLRPDGMGIDYSKIDYHFVDPVPDDARKV